MSEKEARQLLFISDLEGCLPNDVFNKEEQNISLCEKTLYNKEGLLQKFIDTGGKNTNKIAFLGDYFDKGPGIVDSIQGIVGLKRRNPDNVHIILGNRDINKLRLVYELSARADPPNKLGWDMWKNYYEAYKTWHADISDVSTFTHLDNILRNSMGADGITPNWEKDDDEKKKKHYKYLIDLCTLFLEPRGPISGKGEILKGLVGKLNEMISSVIEKTQTENQTETQTEMQTENQTEIQTETQTEMQTEMQTENQTEIQTETQTEMQTEHEAKNNLPDFKEDLKYLFQNGDLVKFDEDFGVLMSHAGGFDKSVFIGYQEKINDITHFINTTFKDTENMYFTCMEYARQILQTPPPNNETLTPDISGILFLHNKNLKDAVNSIFGKPGVDILPPTASYFILQASGLKPDKDHGANNQQFASFIQSCGSGCNSDVPVSNYVFQKFDLNLNVNSKPVKFIAHGHVPHCLPFPLLVSNGDVTFLHNDTSNGQKQTKYVGNTINTLPLSFIEKQNDKMKGKIGLLGENGLTEISENTTNMPQEFNTEYKAFILKMNQSPMTHEQLKIRIGWKKLNTAKIKVESKSGGKTRRRKNRSSRNPKKTSTKRRRRRNRSRNRK